MRTLRSLSLSFLVALLAGSLPAVSLAQTAAKPAAAPAATSAVAKTGQMLDLNSASPTDLKALPGIGDAYAKRIVDGRPYASKNQLLTKGILPQATYDKIKDSIVARRAGK